MTHELWVFLFMVALGAAFSLIYDFMRALHSYIGDKRKLVAITDIIYWLAVSYLLIFGIAYINNGVIRWYEFVGMALGIGIYKLTVSRVIYSILCIVTGYIIKIAEYIFKFFLTAGEFLYKITIVPVGVKINKQKTRIQISGERNDTAEG